MLTENFTSNKKDLENFHDLINIVLAHIMIKIRLEPHCWWFLSS